MEGFIYELGLFKTFFVISSYQNSFFSGWHELRGWALGICGTSVDTEKEILLPITIAMDS